MPHTKTVSTGITASSLAEVMLTKGGQQWVFRYAAGDEPSVLRCIADAVVDPACPLDYADAAALAQQLGSQLARNSRQLL